MKLIAYNARKSDNPIEALFGKEYTSAIRDNEQYIEAYKAKITNLQNLKAELVATWPESGSKLSYARMRYEYFSDEIRQLNRRVTDIEKRIKDGKAESKRKVEQMLDQIDRLAYLKDINTAREIESQSQITFGLGTASPLLALASFINYFIHLNVLNISSAIFGSSVC